MTNEKTKPQASDVSDFIKKHLGHAPLSEQLEAQATVDRHLMVVYRIYLRLKQEGAFPLPPRDKTARVDRVDKN